MVPRLSFTLFAVLSALVAGQDALAVPFGTALTARASSNAHAALAKRYTVSSLDECYAVCDKIFPNHRKRVEFTFTNYNECRSGCAANIKAPNNRNAAVDHGPNGNEYQNPDKQNPPQDPPNASTQPPAPAASKTPDAQPQQPPGGTPAGGDVQAWVDAHNAARATYHAPPVSWDDTLAGYAANYAATCNWDHSKGPYGENFAGTTGGMTPKQAVDMWVGEAAQFNFNTGGFSGATGHFTQVVWKGTTKVGCATHQCAGGSARGLFLVCEYDPPGNYEGQYRTNVSPA